MKLKVLLPIVEERFKTINKGLLENHIKAVKENGGYNNLSNRIAWDCLHATFKSQEICDWYDKYACNDNHITTLAVNAFNKVFGGDFLNV